MDWKLNVNWERLNNLGTGSSELCSGSDLLSVYYCVSTTVCLQVYFILYSKDKSKDENKICIKTD